MDKDSEDAIREYDELMNSTTEEEIEALSEDEAYTKFGYVWFKAHATQCLTDAVMAGFVERIPHRYINVWIRRFVTESNDKMIEEICSGG